MGVSKQGSDEMAGTKHCYMKFWTQEYEAAADVELIVDNAALPAHRHVLSMSPVFAKELLSMHTPSTGGWTVVPLTNAGQKPSRAQIRENLDGVSVDDMCLMLSHVYTTDAHLSPERVKEVCTLLELAGRFGFDAISAKCLCVLNRDSNFLDAVRTDLDGLDPETVRRWLAIAQRWEEGCGLKEVLAKFFSENFKEIFGSSKGEENREVNGWMEVVQAVESDLVIWKRISYHLSEQSVRRVASVQASTDSNRTLAYGVAIGFFSGFFIPNWLIALGMIVVVWLVSRKYQQIFSRTFEGLAYGVLQHTIAATLSGGGKFQHDEKLGTGPELIRAGSYQP